MVYGKHLYSLRKPTLEWHSRHLNSGFFSVELTSSPSIATTTRVYLISINYFIFCCSKENTKFLSCRFIQISIGLRIFKPNQNIVIWQLLEHLRNKQIKNKIIACSILKVKYANTCTFFYKWIKDWVVSAIKKLTQPHLLFIHNIYPYF